MISPITRKESKVLCKMCASTLQSLVDSDYELGTKVWNMYINKLREVQHVSGIKTLIHCITGVQSTIQYAGYLSLEEITAAWHKYTNVEVINVLYNDFIDCIVQVLYAYDGTYSSLLRVLSYRNIVVDVDALKSEYDVDALDDVCALLGIE